MDDKIVSELKTLNDSVERLRSIENLLERVADSNERMARMLDQAWEAYMEMIRRTSQPPQQ